MRPDVLAYPSPTTSRYLIFATALLSSGLFVGGWLHNQTVGQEWARTFIACQDEYGGTPVDVGGASYEAHQAVLECAADVEWTRAWITLGGAALAALVSVGILLVAPGIVRRARGLRELGPRLEGAGGRFRSLAEEAGVSGRVRPMLGPLTQRDAFSFGRPGDYVVALPPAVAVRWRNPALFDALVSHELAHVRHRDVALAWLTRSVWFALAPLLLLPVVVGLVSRDSSLLAGYAWRAVLLAIVVALVSAALLRSREYDADLRAARLRGGPAAMSEVLGSTARRPGLRRLGLLANHPTAEARLRVLENPASAARAGFLDGFTAGFLVALSVPLLIAATSPATAQLGDSNVSYLVAAVVLGPLLAGSVGLGAWRDALISRVTGGRASGLALAAGVGAGLVLGKAASLQQTAAGLTGLQHPAWLAVLGLVGAGGTLLSSSLGQLWADLTPRFRSARACWIVALLANTALFTGLLWASELFVFAVDTGGWVFGRAGLRLTLSTWPLGLIVLALAGLTVAALVLGRRSAAMVPSWLVEDGGSFAWPPAPRLSLRTLVMSGVAAGLVGVGAIVVFRLTQGEAASDDEWLGRILAAEWLAGAAAAICVVILAVLRPGWGAAAGLLSGVVAVIVVTAGFVPFNAVLDGSFRAAQIELFLTPALCLALFLGTALLPVGSGLALLVRRELSGAAVVGVLGAAALAIAVGVLSGRTFLVGLNPATEVLTVATVGPRAPSDIEVRDDLKRYVDGQGAALEAKHHALEETMGKILNDHRLSPAVRAKRLRVEVLGPLRDLSEEAQDFDAASKQLDDAHAEAEAALRTCVEKVEVVVEALRLEDQTLLDRASVLRDQEDDHWTLWYDQLDQLRLEVTS